ncbi:MAG: hypothetical protein QF903_13375 [Planctomycetota bacterium]|jgi:hypothetical protein|nr:hypothetical protein [Planctomycetota bacterium]MDP6761637.1 hypothetical protein [Planctomycetota bacterium]MDP6990454.1 hypothetical protein [Planctomycetota bacterium]
MDDPLGGGSADQTTRHGIQVRLLAPTGRTPPRENAMSLARVVALSGELSD